MRSSGASPSVKGIRERLLGTRRLDIFVPQLSGSRIPDRALETARLLRNLLEASPEREIRIYTECTTRDSVMDSSGVELEALALLAEAERAGRILFYCAGSVSTEIPVPRLASDAQSRGFCFYVDERQRPLLDGLLPSNCVFVEGVASTATKATVEGIRRASRREHGALEHLIRDTQRFEYLPGNRRCLSEPFAPLKGTDKARITIRDPYLLARRHNLESTLGFVQFLASICDGIEGVTLVWRSDGPVHSGGSGGQDSSDSITEFKSALRRNGLNPDLVRFSPQAQRRRRALSRPESNCAGVEEWLGRALPLGSDLRRGQSNG